MRKHVGVRIAVVISGTLVCALMTWVSFIIMIFAPFATETSLSDSDASGFALLGSLIVWLGTLMAYGFPRAAAVLIGIGTLVFSPIAIMYNDGNAGFVPFLILLFLGASYGIREREKHLQAQIVKIFDDSNLDDSLD